MSSRYGLIIERVFHDHYSQGADEVRFDRDSLVVAADTLGLDVPRNLGDLIYSFRYRNPLPSSIAEAAPEGKEWLIQGTGHAEYAFVLRNINRILPNPSLLTIKIPDATPEIVLEHSLSDEQALLAKIRYNRLIDVFLGMSAYSLQSHLRTTVSGIGQIEIDEVYVAVDRNGRQFVLPIQAKGGRDQLSVIQSRQDIECCVQKYPSLVCRPISAQFTEDDRIVLFELVLDGEEIRVAAERHYRLVPSSEITTEDLEKYGRVARE